MRLLADLGDADRFLGEARAGGESLIIASAHVGALYAGPLALELLGVPCRWLASTPSTSPYYQKSSHSTGLASG